MTVKQKARLREHIRKLRYNRNRAAARADEARASYLRHAELLRRAIERLKAAT